MLTIREAQMHALSQTRESAVEVRLAAHLAGAFPAAAAMDRTALRDLIRHGITRARAHGFTTERQIARYLNVQMVFGRDFDVEQPWAASALEARDLPPDFRIARLCEKAIRAAESDPAETLD